MQQRQRRQKSTKTRTTPKRGIDFAESSWILEDNELMNRAEGDPMPKLRFLILATAVLAGGLLTPACGDDPTGPESVAGLYILQTVNGETLPVFLNFTLFTISAGSFQLKSDGTYTISLTIDVGSGPETDIDTGTFTVDGSNIVLDDGRTGTVSGDTLTINVAATKPYLLYTNVVWSALQ